MKCKSTLLTIALIGAVGAQAAVLTPTEALLRAQTMMPRSVTATMPSPLTTMKTATLAYTLTDSATAEACLYGFDQPGPRGGWVIVSADDAAVPMLAYGDCGSLDADNLPPAFVQLMAQYREEIKQARRLRMPASGEYPNGLGRPRRDPVAPLCSTKWNQGAPYNNLCPTYNGSTSVTGCAATAMAQVMKVHQWPAKGQGTVSYTWDRTNTTLTLDESTMVFDWSKMLNVYTSGSYTTAQGTAVATLMKACGYAIEMNYGPSSGAGTLETAAAYPKYFNYSEDVDLIRRNNYTLREWEDIIYANLAQRRPVQYAGYNDLVSGHSYVVDGLMSNCYFHLNWGWGGSSDGYFLLSALDPDSQGIGGSAAGYSIGNEVIVNIHEPAQGEKCDLLHAHGCVLEIYDLPL